MLCLFLQLFLPLAPHTILSVSSRPCERGQRSRPGRVWLRRAPRLRKAKEEDSGFLLGPTHGVRAACRKGIANLVEVILDLNASSWDDVKGLAQFGLETSGSISLYHQGVGFHFVCHYFPTLLISTTLSSIVSSLLELLNLLHTDAMSGMILPPLS